MYFLRRRHGRKPPTEARRETLPAQAPATYEAPEREREPEPEPVAPPRPKVITKAKRQRIALPGEEDCKPAGTFRAGTLHLDRRAEAHARHGKL